MKHIVLKTLLLTNALLSAFFYTSAQSETVASDTIVILQEMPEYSGGLPALIKYIGSELKYPPKARKQGIEGTVRVSFFVEKNGDVSDVTVIQRISDECDAEAARVVQHSGK